MPSSTGSEDEAGKRSNRPSILTQSGRSSYSANDSSFITPRESPTATPSIASSTFRGTDDSGSITEVNATQAVGQTMNSKTKIPVPNTYSSSRGRHFSPEPNSPLALSPAQTPASPPPTLRMSPALDFHLSSSAPASNRPSTLFTPNAPSAMLAPMSTIATSTTALGPQGSGSSSEPSLDDPFHCHEDDSHSTKTNSNKKAVRVLWLSVVVCVFFMLCEVFGGIWAQSLAIITDAAHLLTDLASMLISLFSLYLASRPASQRMSFGWHRAEVVGAFISVFMIWVVTGILVYLAIDRMITKNYDINPTVMAITAGVGVMVNLLMGALLYFGGHSHSHIGGGGGHSHGTTTKPSITQHNQGNRRHSVNGGGAAIQSSTPEDTESTHLLTSSSSRQAEECGGDGGHRTSDTNINVRAAFIHVLGDLIQSVGVLMAALVILWNDSWSIVDPICTLLFSVIVVSTTVYIVRDALVVLLEGRPSSIDFRVVFDSLEKIEGVRKVHDLRIWALTMNKLAISVHLEIAPDAQAQTVLKTTTLMLRKDFNVHESTVQIEGWQPESENCFQCIIPTS